MFGYWTHGGKARRSMVLQAVRDGFYRVVIDSGAQGFVPRDMWLTDRLNYCLNAAFDREAYLLSCPE